MIEIDRNRAQTIVALSVYGIGGLLRADAMAKDQAIRACKLADWLERELHNLHNPESKTVDVILGLAEEIIKEFPNGTV